MPTREVWFNEAKHHHLLLPAEVDESVSGTAAAWRVSWNSTASVLLAGASAPAVRDQYYLAVREATGGHRALSLGEIRTAGKRVAEALLQEQYAWQVAGEARNTSWELLHLCELARHADLPEEQIKVFVDAVIEGLHRRADPTWGRRARAREKS